MKKATNCTLLAVALALVLSTISCNSSESGTNPPEKTSSTGLDLASIPLESTLTSGLPTLAEFGRGICIPCKAMKPILEDLAVEYEGKLNVVIVEIDDHMEQTRQHGIMVIPTQIFFNREGQEVTRHIGLWPKEDIIAQLTEMEIE